MCGFWHVVAIAAEHSLLGELGGKAIHIECRNVVRGRQHVTVITVGMDSLASSLHL